MLCTDLPWQGINEDQNLGIAITRRALEAPLRAIVANAGEEPSVIVANVKAGEGSYGYNAATGEFGDMIAMGILDPTKVTRSALQHAASVAGYRKYKPPFCSSSEVSYLKFPHSFTAQAPILTAGPA